VSECVGDLIHTQSLSKARCVYVYVCVCGDLYTVLSSGVVYLMSHVST
jgi:hypothetical protein